MGPPDTEQKDEFRYTFGSKLDVRVRQKRMVTSSRQHRPMLVSFGNYEGGSWAESGSFRGEAGKRRSQKSTKCPTSSLPP